MHLSQMQQLTNWAIIFNLNLNHKVYNVTLCKQTIDLWNQGNLIPMMNNWNCYMGAFLESFVWSSTDHSKDNLKNNYLVLKSNYFIFV